MRSTSGLLFAVRRRSLSARSRSIRKTCQSETLSPRSRAGAAIWSQQVGPGRQEIGMVAQERLDMFRQHVVTFVRVALSGVVSMTILSPAYRIACPVFCQSARKASRPLSVSVWLASLRSTSGGTVATSAPIMAACLTCMGERIEATRISVSRSG